MKIDKFEGQYWFLSNFFTVEITYKGKVYPSSEHIYQAFKTLDAEEQETVRLASTAGKSKRLGKTVTLRSDWDEIKDELMEDILFHKFRQGAGLASQLIATGDAELIEGNSWGDEYWGVCNGIGWNKLGKMLMKLRDQLKNVTSAIHF